MYTVYVLYSDTYDVYYKGYSTHLELRLEDHNNNKSRYTANKGPWKLVYSRQFESKQEALIEEKRIKRLNRQAIEKLVAG